MNTRSFVQSITLLFCFCLKILDGCARLESMCFGRCHGSIDSKSSFASIHGEMLLLCTLYIVFDVIDLGVCVRTCVCMNEKIGNPHANE